MLKNGATLVTCAEDILNALNWEVKVEQLSLTQLDINSDEKKICDAIAVEEKGFDELLQVTKLSIDELLSLLTMLELKGIIKQVDGDRYRKVV